MQDGPRRPHVNDRTVDHRLAVDHQAEPVGVVRGREHDRNLRSCGRVSARFAASGIEPQAAIVTATADLRCQGNRCQGNRCQHKRCQHKRCQGNRCQGNKMRSSIVRDGDEIPKPPQLNVGKQLFKINSDAHISTVLNLVQLALNPSIPSSCRHQRVLKAEARVRFQISVDSHISTHQRRFPIVLVGYRGR